MKFVPAIRPAIKTDAPYLIDIDVKSFDHAWLDDDWAIVWDDQDASIYVATVYGNPIGFMATERQEHNGKLLNHIYKVAVKEQFRGNNVGRMLLAHAYEEAKQSGMSYLSLSVPESMTVENSPRYCLPWIQKMGFVATETVGTERLWGQKEEVILFMFEVR